MMNQYGFSFRAFDGVTSIMNNINASLGKTEQKAQNTQQMLGGMGGMFKRMLGGLAIGYVAHNVYEVTKSYQQLTNTLTFASGDAATFNHHMKFVHDTVDKMGLPLDKSIEGFTGLMAAVRGGPLASKVEDIFRGVSTGASVLGLSTEKTERVFLALSQIASKGKLQAEELRGQIGEAMPGAFHTAAKAMGVTEQALNKMLDDGKVNATEFLGKFASAMEQEYAGGLDKSVNSATAKYNRFRNELLRRKVQFGDMGMSVVNNGLDKLTGMLQGLGGFMDRYQTRIVGFFNGIGDAFNWVGELLSANSAVIYQAFDFISNVIGASFTLISNLFNGLKQVWHDHSELITFLANAVATFGFAVVLINGVTSIWAGTLAVVKAATFAYGIAAQMITLFTSGWTVAAWALNAAFMANPIGITIGLIVALAAAVVASWNHFSGFRSFIVGMWEVFKEFGNIVYDYAIAPLLSFVKILQGIFTMDKSKLMEGFTDAVNASKRMLEAPMRISVAYEKGSIAGAKADKIDPLGALSNLIAGPKQPDLWVDQDSANTVYGDARKGGAGAGFAPKGLTGKDLGTSGGGSQSGISGGGSIKHISITIQKMVESLNINTTTLSESAAQTRDQMTRVLLDSANDANYAN